MESNDFNTTANKKKIRPAQRLYVPPAQRNKRHEIKATQDKVKSLESIEKLPCDKVAEMKIVKEENLNSGVMDTVKVDTIPQKTDSLIETHIKNVENLKISDVKSDVDGEQEEMQRAIVNINRKTRPLIKHVSVVKNDILHIDVDKKAVSKLNNHLNEVSNWEDLFNEDDDISGNCVNQAEESIPILSLSDDTEEEESVDTSSCKRNKTLEDFEHVIELYDFPSTFKSQDIMQLYHEIKKEATMYIKWCDDTHALLVFSTPALAQRALNIKNDVIKARALTQTSGIAYQTAMKADLKPAMKRPPTTMQTARRLITTHLGTRTKLSKEEQEKEREVLRKAKEMKKCQRQNEVDAWEGFSRPSTA